MGRHSIAPGRVRVNRYLVQAFVRDYGSRYPDRWPGVPACLGLVAFCAVLTACGVVFGAVHVVPVDPAVPVVAEVAPVATTVVPDPPIVSRPIEPDVPVVSEPDVEPPVITTVPAQPAWRPQRTVTRSAPTPRPTVQTRLPVRVYPLVTDLGELGKGHGKHPKGGEK